LGASLLFWLKDTDTGMRLLKEQAVNIVEIAMAYKTSGVLKSDA
jgi:hypothetical protein